jgi:hypothetical protein
MANAPLSERDGKSYSRIYISEKQKYFCKGDWTAQISLISFKKLAFRRKGGLARSGKVSRPLHRNFVARLTNAASGAIVRGWRCRCQIF